jgi:hypothetical protein
LAGRRFGGAWTASGPLQIVHPTLSPHGVDGRERYEILACNPLDYEPALGRLFPQTRNGDPAPRNTNGNETRALGMTRGA